MWRWRRRLGLLGLRGDGVGWWDATFVLVEEGGEFAGRGCAAAGVVVEGVYGGVESLVSVEVAFCVLDAGVGEMVAERGESTRDAPVMLQKSVWAACGGMSVGGVGGDEDRP